MLRALFERGIAPDLVLGTSVGALNGAHGRPRPDAGGDRPAHRPVARAPRAQPGGVRRPAAAHGPPGGVDRHPHLLRRAAAAAAASRSSATSPSRTCRSGSRCCAASIERAAEHWFDTGRLVDAVVASAAVPGLLPPARGRRRALPRRRHRELDPGRPGRRSSAPTRVFVLQVGRIDRPLTVPRRPWEVARVSFEIARRHRFAREMAELPDGVEAHVLPGPRHVEPRRLAAGLPRLLAACSSRIDATLRRVARPTSTGCRSRVIWLLRRLRARAGGDRADRRCSGCTLPLWLIVAAALSPVLPGRWRALRLLWVLVLYLTCESAAAGRAVRALARLGLRPADPDAVLRGHPLRPRAGPDVGVLPRGPAGAAAADRDRRARRPDAHPGHAAAGLLPARRPGRLVHADPRADALVRPRAARRAQGHPGLGPGRSTWC